MFRSLLRITVALVAAAPSQGYPVTITNCGVAQTVADAPTRAITMNQGATEFLLAMGLEGSMVGTAYLDDAIWPQYADAYATIPVLSSSYPNDTYIMAQNPDFIVGSYNSAFRGKYMTSKGMRGIFGNDTAGPCTGTGSDWGQSWTTCRPQLHAKGVGTYLFEDACEDTKLRPTEVTEETVYKEMRALGSVFGVDVEPKITEMKQDFDQAATVVSTDADLGGAQLKTVWLDCVGRCCKDQNGNPDPSQVFVGGGTGAPNMLMREAGLTNVFAGKSGNWVCVNVSDVVIAAPDVIVIVDAAWDTAISKIEYLYDHPAFCQLDVLRGARFITIPFSATTLSPRNGPAALDLAIAALHVKSGKDTAMKKSGVSYFSPFKLVADTDCRLCPLQLSNVVYTDSTDSASNYQKCTKAAGGTGTGTGTGTRTETVNKAGRISLGLWWWAAVGAAAVLRPSMISA